MANKKGQEMSVSTLVLIVIAVILLVLLVLGFSMGWQNLWNKINIFGGGSDVSAVIQACNLAASGGDKYAFCNDFKLIKISGQNVYVNCQSNQVDTSLSNRLDCGKNIDELAKDFCNGVSESQRNSTKVISSAGVGEGTMKTCTQVLAAK